MNAAVRLEILVEEESAERPLRELVPRIVPEVGFEIRTQGKPALLRELPKRMQGYAQVRKFEPGLKVLILVDRDDDDCLRLKSRLEKIVSDVGLASLSSARGGGAVVATWIAVEELEDRGYHPGGLPKVLLAQNVARHLDVDGNRSRSFAHFRDGVRRLIESERVA